MDYACQYVATKITCLRSATCRLTRVSLGRRTAVAVSRPMFGGGAAGATNIAGPSCGRRHIGCTEHVRVSRLV